MAFKFNPFTGTFDYYESGGGGSAFIEVANYSALPAAGTAPGQTYIVLASQGVPWIGGLFGGSYYGKGYYYDTGSAYIYTEVPYQATQAEVNTGTNTDKFVTPSTLTNATVVTSKAPLASPTFTGTVILPKTLEIQDTSADHQYVLAVNELSADRTITLPLLIGNDTFVFQDHIQTLTNKRHTKRRVAVAGPGATPTTNTDNCDIASFTALATAITSMTTNLSGTPAHGDMISIEFTDNGTARAITFGASFAASGTLALPTTTVISTLLRCLFQWNSVTSKWEIVALV